MTTTPKSNNTSWFATGGKSYAEFRPLYPKALAQWLAFEAPSCAMAADIGCGTGQLTEELAHHFDHVIGIDPSADQLAHTRPNRAIRFETGHAEALPLPDQSCDIITAAQAAHWFDLSRFYAETIRVLKPEGLLALISYGRPELEPSCQERFMTFYQNEIGPFWPPERKHVDDGYRQFDFPFAEIKAPTFNILLDWTADDFLGYVQTWSATKAVLKAGQWHILTAFGNDIKTLWGEKENKRNVTWPISIRAGRCIKS